MQQLGCAGFLTRALVPGVRFDCILIDGDHNWYTVFNELRLIRERTLLKAGGYIFLHDVDWPYGRRDLYYQPETIPAEFRHPFAEKGIVRGQSPLAEVGSMNSRNYLNAMEEGGPKNGVLTAIEDFLALHPGDYRFFMIRYQWGLGVLQLRSALPFSGLSFRMLQAKAFLLSPVSRLARSIKFAFKPQSELIDLRESQDRLKVSAGIHRIKTETTHGPSDLP